MRLEFLGTGTSYGVPQIGCFCDVCSSNDFRDKRSRCSIWLQTESLSIIVDTGPDFRCQCLRSGVLHIDAVLYTHFHADHVFGLDDLRQFNTLQKSRLPVYAPYFMIERFKEVFGYTIEEAERGLNRPQLELSSIDETPIHIEDLQIQPVDVWHGREKIKGYVFRNRGVKISYLVDCKALPPPTVSEVIGSDVVILSALWNKPRSHPAHLNLDEAIKLAKELHCGSTYLTHITHKMGRYSATQKSLPETIFLAYDGLILDL